MAVRCLHNSVLHVLRDDGAPGTKGCESVQRSFFMLGGAAALAGCDAANSLVSSVPNRKTRTFTPAIGDPPEPASSSTPNPTDPDSGLKIIGGTRARWDPNITAENTGIDWSSVYFPTGQPGGITNFKTLYVNTQIFKAHLKNCGVLLATSAGAVQQFVDAAIQKFGPRIVAAAGGMALTDLALYEVVGIVLATLTASEVAGLLIGISLTVAALAAAYACVAQDPPAQ